MTADVPSHEESLCRILEMLVDETADSGALSITPRKLLEILRQAAPAIVVPDSGWVSWQVSGSGGARLVAGFRDAVFDLGLDFMEAVQTARAGEFDIRDLPDLVERCGRISEDETVRRATKTAAYGVEISVRRAPWHVGDVLAVPVGSGYRLAVVLPRTSFGWAVGVLQGTHRFPPTGSIDSPRVDTWFYTEHGEYLSGRWLKVGSDKGLVQMFPKVLERFHYRPVIVPLHMANASFGFAEDPDGGLRVLDKQEAERLGLLDGSYRQSHLSSDVARFLGERPRG